MSELKKNNLSIDNHTEEGLPFDIKKQLSILPAKAQEEFYYEYQRVKKRIGWAYIAHFMVGGSYAYLGKWLKQLLFWATGYGFGVLWVINLFRIPYLVRKTNEKISSNLLRYLQKKYPPTKDRQHTSVQKYPTPRKIHITYDPINLSINNLKINFILDYKLKTWKVIDEEQFDWSNGQTDRLFKLVSGIEALYILIKQAEYYALKKINIYALNTDMDNHIETEGKPPNLITYQKEVFYRESILTGFVFKFTDKKKPNLTRHLTGWEYFNEVQNKYIVIYKKNNQNYDALVGQVEADYNFSDILPSNE